jgi:hypothetical protein
MIPDLVTLATYNIVFYGGVPYKQLIRKYTGFGELTEVTFVKFYDWISGRQNYAFNHNDLNFTYTYDLNVWMHDMVIPAKVVCKLEKKIT